MDVDTASSLAAVSVTRRELVKGVGALIAGAALGRAGRVPNIVTRLPPSTVEGMQPYAAEILPAGIRSRLVENVNGVSMHVLESGFETTSRPLVVLLHGFPELAYSWRKVMPSLAAAGFHVLAPDRRGYGRTSGSDVGYDDDLDPFATLNHVRDVVSLVSIFGYRSVTALIGHDQGSPIAAWCSLVRPDLFRSVVMMSAPFGGPPATPFGFADSTPGAVARANPVDNVYADLAALNPPRKHYQKYYATREANPNMWHAPQGVHAFLRAYYHMKSADWPDNNPFPLKARTAVEWAKLPRYYIMDVDKGMAETVAPSMPSPAAIASCKWLPESELKVYSEEYGRTGFQGGLQGYRVLWVTKYNAELQLFSGRTIDVPSLFIAGKKDWGPYQNPGALERMQKVACTRMLGLEFVEGAGHWVQQEQPDAVTAILTRFLRDGSRA